MVSTSLLRAFLAETIHAENNLNSLPPSNCHGQSEWQDYLGMHLDLTAVPLRSGEGIAKNYPLLIAQHEIRGTCLIKYSHELLREPTNKLLSLDTGETGNILPEDMLNLKNVRVLFECLNIEQNFSARNMGNFVFKPVKRLLRQITLFQVLLTFLSSLIFMINYNVLLHVVPSMSTGAFWAISWLMLAVFITIFLSHFVIKRSRIYLDSIADEREEALRLSLMWSLQPGFVTEHGPSRVLDLCSVLAGAGRAMADIYLTAIASLAVLPVLILMYLRLPTGLFVSASIFAVIATALQVYSELHLKKQSHKMSLNEAQSANLLFKIINHTQRLKFYNQVQVALRRWRLSETENIKNRFSQSRFKIDTGEILGFVTGLVQLLAILLLTFSVSRSHEQGESVSIAQAFIIIHLVTTTYMMIPRFAEAIKNLAILRIDMESVQEILDDLQKVNDLNVSKVTSAEVRVDCTKLKLPHNCNFSTDGGLDMTIIGPKIVHVAGESGTGKTTFLKCLLGLQKPIDGQLKVFGVNPMELSKEERGRIFGYVSQDVQLLPGSLRDNLNLFGAGIAKERDIWNALDRVLFTEQVKSLPLGLDTPIADARRNFSTGERQRIILAQILLKKSSILVLDEAMSGLPESIEKQIFSNIRDLFDQIYFVSHRQHLKEMADMRIFLGDEIK